MKFYCLNLIFNIFCISNAYVNIDHKNFYKRENKGFEFNNITYTANLFGDPALGYYMKMSIGTPPQIVNIMIDTGSSNFAVSAKHHYNSNYIFNITSSSTLKITSEKVSVSYVQGKWEGVKASDIISFVPNISFYSELSLIMYSENFFNKARNWHGIVGLAYPTLSKPNDKMLPLFDKFIETQKMKYIFAIILCPLPNIIDDNSTGYLDVGGLVEKHYIGEIYYVPIYQNWFYDVVITGLSVNNDAIAIDCKELNYDKSIIDSGTTKLLFPPKVHRKLIQSLQLHSNIMMPINFWNAIEYVCYSSLNEVPFNKFPLLSLSIASSTNESLNLVVGPQHYLLLTTINDIEQIFCIQMAIDSSETGVVIGAVFMSAFYTIFDQEYDKIGFALSRCNQYNEMTKINKTTLKFDGNLFDCAYFHGWDLTNIFYITIYSCLGVCLFLTLIMALFIVIREKLYFKVANYQPID